MEQALRERMIERTLAVIKPDGVKRSLAGEIISRFEKVGLKIIGIKMSWIEKEFAKKHYGEDIAKKHGIEVRERLLAYISEGPVIAMVLEGVDAVNVVRKIVGSTYPNEAPAGTIRGDYAHISKVYANTKEIHVKNLIHASGTKEEAKAEISLWFKNNELHSYKGVHDEHLF